MIQFNSVLSLLGVTSDVASISSATANKTVVSLTDGTIVTIEKNAQPPVVLPAPTATYLFDYPSSTKRFNPLVSRIVDVQNPYQFLNKNYIEGLERTNDGPRFKRFLKHRMSNLAVK